VNSRILPFLLRLRNAAIIKWFAASTTQITQVYEYMGVILK